MRHVPIGTRHLGVIAALLAATFLWRPAAADAQCAAGVDVGGSCWFVSDFGESCTDACAAAGFAYDEATRTYAGSDGTDANCMAVLAALGETGPFYGGSTDCNPGPGLGCGDLTGATGRCALPPTTADAAFGGFTRACACDTATPVPLVSNLGWLLLAGMLGFALRRTVRHSGDMFHAYCSSEGEDVRGRGSARVG